MPYYVEKNGKRSDGTYFWRLTWREGKESRSIDKRSSEAKKLGFNSELTYQQAKSLATKLQAESWVEREAKLESRAKAVIEGYKRYRDAFLTDIDAEQFEREYLKEYKIKVAHWNTLQKLIIGIGLHPSQWHKQRSKVYEQFLKHRLSYNYAKKLLRYLNLWGYFICEKYDKPWMKVEGINGIWKNKLEQRRRPGGSSNPLSPTLLEDKKDDIPEKYYRWIYISVWFGLRPEEVDQLRKENGLWRIETHPELGFILHVFQTKLEKRGVPPKHCWKRIPTVFEEQKKAIQIIRDGKFSRPIGKQGKFMRDIFGAGYSLYAGRNNFSGMLRDAGYDKEERRHWMGHLSVITTERYDRKTEGERVYITSRNLKKAS